MPDQTVRLFGIRHHGPGCARSLLRALEAMQPDCLLIEGPPDGESVLPFVLESGMCPPVALLVYAPDDSRRAVFYPFAEFSPEWQALRYGLGQSLPVRFMDLPIAHQFGLDKAFEDECRAKEEALRDAEGRTKTDAAEGTEAPASGAQAPENTATNTLAPEQPEGGDTDGNAGGEASAQEDVYGDPLDWLGRAAGYGDGEAWWNHMVEERIDGLELFDAIREAMTALRAEAPRRERGEWETRREALRERPRPGLPELYEALQTTVCMGDPAPLRLIERQLIVGDKLGTIPETTPTVPLQRDLEQQQKSLRLKPEAARKVLDLDLRQANDLARSHLLHRLRLLEIGWATPGGSRNAKGTFHELWEMQWVPELPIAVIAASRWGNTIFEAATAKAVELSGEADLLRLAELVNDILFADLPDAVGHATRMLEEKAATANDVGQLLEAIPPLAAIARYGNVRQTDAGMVARVLEGLIPRASIGLPGACTSLDDESAAAMRARIIAAHNAIRLLGNEGLWESWLSALHQTALRDGMVHELLRGMAVRLLFDEQRLPVEEAARLMSLSLSAAAAPASASAWIEGFLNQSALVLLHDDALWGVLANWLDSLNDTHFTNILPMLRRTFSGFSAPERRQLGERAKRAAGKPMQKQAETRWDAERAALPVPLLRRVLGLTAQA